jgi:MFS family permease
MLFLSVLAPLLPTYVDRLGLNDPEAGLLSSAYAWGAVVAAFPSALLAQKLGPRKLICWSLVALSVTTFLYAWAEQVVALDLTRFAQGLCGAAVWSGAMTWLMEIVPKERKGAVIGTVTSAGGIGALIGPIVGAIGVAVSSRWLFPSCRRCFRPSVWPLRPPLTPICLKRHRFGPQLLRSCVAHSWTPPCS